jgi:hypothetical protein
VGAALDELIDLTADLQVGGPVGGVTPDGMHVWVAVVLPSRGYIEHWGRTAEHAAQALLDDEFPGLVDPGESEPMMTASIREQVERIQAGDVAVAVSLARTLGVRTVTDLVGSVFPAFDPEPWQFDVCADAIAAVSEEAVYSSRNGWRAS